MVEKVDKKMDKMMRSHSNVIIKDHSPKPVTSDALDFYQDYWVKGSEISQKNIQHRKKLLDYLFPEGIRNKRIAELGPGGEGGYIGLLQSENDTIGFDASASAIELCRQWGLKVVLKNLDIDRLPLESNSLDYVFAMEVFEHFASPQFVMEEIRRVLTHEGAVIISTPNPLIYHWPKLFYPELFEADAFQNFLMSNQFSVENRIGFRSLLLERIHKKDNFWSWIWYCKKVAPGDYRRWFEFGLHFWNQKYDAGFRKKPIEAIDFFRQSHEAAPSEPEPRFYLARSLVYRFIYGAMDEFVSHFNYIAHVMQNGPEDQISAALYHFAMIYVELELLGKQQMSRQTLQTAMTRLAQRGDGAAYLEKINTALEAVEQPSVKISDHVPSGQPSAMPSEKIQDLDFCEPGKFPGTRQTVYLGLVKGENYGWGMCSRYLIEALSKDLDVHVLVEEDGSAKCDRLDGPLFQGLANHEFTPIFPEAAGTRNFAYTFFENELTPHSIENAKRFELVFGGSTWCRDRMVEKGIQNCGILIQGIDPDVFHPVHEIKPEDRFVLFSGGKFELRKGQDLVLRALKILQEKYSDIWLVNCWYNLWPASTRLMEYSRHIQFKYRENEAWRDCMRRTVVLNGLDPERIITYELVPHEQQRELFAQTDIGVFPNRCEGGTNLVMMEYMACAKPVIASNTSGHKDILTEHNALRLDALSGFNVNDARGQIIARWQEPSVDELVAQIEYAYHHRNDIRAIGRQAGEDLKQLTWEHTAGCLKQAMDI